MFSIIKRQDWFLNSAILFLAIAGLTIIYSGSPNLFWYQLLWFGLGFLGLFLLPLIDWRPIINYPRIIFGAYFLVIALLIVTLFLAPTIRESKSWLVFGPIQFQTSELAKAALIIAFAYFFARRHVGIAHFGILATSLALFLTPAVLILAQPDLGAALILFGIWLGFLLVSGVQWRHLAIGLFLFLVIAALAWGYFLKDYQKERIIGLFNPEYDPLGVNYSVIQSKIAIGSAGFLGKGFGQGTQVQLGFLPEAETDFVLAAFIEEWGLLGGFLIIAAFSFLMLRIIRIGLISENNFSRFVCLGAVIMFLLQFILNVGSSIGLSPVVGVTFPFLSYGGSSILTNFILIGIIQSIAVRSR